MKISKIIGFAILAISLCLSACSSGSDEPITPSPNPEVIKSEITIDSNIISNGLSFTSEKGEQSISFSTNENWTLSVASTTSGSTWCTASALSGIKGNTTVKFSVTENSDYDNRSVSVTIKSGSASKTFTISQKCTDAMLVTADKYEISQEGDTIDIEVKANISYTMEISDEAKSWITESTSRGLASYKHSLNIAMNEENEKREGEVYFKSGDKVETVKIYQAGGAILLLSENEYQVSDKGDTISVDIKSNIDFGVQMPDVDWIVDEASSRGLSSHTLKYVITTNNSYDSRCAEIIFYDKNGDLRDTIKVFQTQKDAIILSNKYHEFSAKGGDLSVKIKSNYIYEYSINTKWIEEKNTKARSLNESKIDFFIKENETSSKRNGLIYILDVNKNINDSIIIVQYGKTLEDNNWDGNFATTFQSGTGEIDDPYIIATCAQMQKIANDVLNGESYKNKYFKLIANLSFNNLEQLSIGSESRPFQGYFDGNGCQISNFRKSLFDYIYDTDSSDDFKTTICNIILCGSIPIDNVSLCKTNHNAIIENCKNTITIKNYNFGGNLGGLVGNNSGTIINCINEGDINIQKEFGYPNHKIGGICGYNSGTIKKCINRGVIISDDSGVGGIVGYSTGYIYNCSNWGDIQGKLLVAGIAGTATSIDHCINYGTIKTTYLNRGEYDYNTKFTYTNTTSAGICAHLAGVISYCKNLGDIYSYDLVGGICGYLYSGTILHSINQGEISSLEEQWPLNNAGGIVGYAEKGSVQKSYSTANIDESLLYTGAICGYNKDGNIQNCFWLNNEFTSRGIGVNEGESNNVFYFSVNEQSCSIHISDNECKDLIMVMGENLYEYRNDYHSNFVLPEFTFYFFDK